MERSFLNIMKRLSRLIVLALMLILILSMLLGTADLFILFTKQIFSADPYTFLINVKDLYLIFSVLLIIIVGYELFKSMYLILDNEKIPVKSILKVAIIALSNKVITLDLKEVEFMELFGVAALIISLGLAYFCFNKDKQIDD